MGEELQARRTTAPQTTIDRLQRAYALGKLVGEAPAFRAAIARLPAIARADATVLLSGETGTGKELVARAIHYLSERSTGSFTAVNCGSLPDTLFEDDFFGHERGAFTDAKASRSGLLNQAHGGTLLLDEVDSLSPRAQVALLRVLQDRTYRALGSSEERRADVRVIAATNADLWPLVEAKQFRSDLYYRLSVLTIALPPLSQRSEDILPLTHHFLLRLTPSTRGPFRLAPEAKDALLAHAWPGNVRELENAVLRAVSLCETDTITASDLGLGMRSVTRARSDDAAHTKVVVDFSRPFGEAKRDTIAAFELNYLTGLMKDCGGNVSRAARRARKERRDFRRLLHKHRLDPREFERS
ncbi:MAG TPA: sigma-54 dependent transcriptional regulator [Gemmatimonadaceae bacterium]|nr:sigma-54 dependent transcriptional regulator [Gemmatimonadaceae bacterium]